MAEKDPLAGIERFEKDPRIIWARSVEDFALIGTNGIKGAILKNPYQYTPEQRDEIISALTTERRPEVMVSQADAQNAPLPAYVKGTASLMYQAFEQANHGRDTDAHPLISARRNLPSPLQPHCHGLTVIADVFGETTIGYTGPSEKDLGEEYRFPAGAIIAFEDIPHMAGRVKVIAGRIDQIERLNFVMNT